MDRLVVPGYDVGEPVTGAVGAARWRARAADGRAVVARLVLDATGPGERDRLRRRCAHLSALQHPHLVPVRDVVAVPTGAVLVSDDVGGSSLRCVLAAEPAVTLGQLVTLAAPLADAVDAAHGLGLAFGAVSEDAVAIDPQGRPVLYLADAVTSPRPTPGEPPADQPADQPAEDVRGLAVVCVRALTAGAGASGAGLDLPAWLPADLRKVLVAALDTDAEVRPTARQLAATLYASAVPEPLTMPGREPSVAATAVAGPARHPTVSPSRPPVPGGAHRAAARPSYRARAVDRSRPGLSRTVRTVLAAVLALALAAAAGWAWGRTGGAGPVGRLPAVATARAPDPRPAPWVRPVPSVGPVPGPTRSAAVPPVQRWAGVVAELDRARAAAYASGDAAALSSVFAPGPLLTQDVARIRSLVLRGLRARDLRHRVVSVSVLSDRPGRVVLRVVDILPATALVDAAGQTVERVPGRPARTWRTELVGTAAGGYRVAAMRAG